VEVSFEVSSLEKAEPFDPAYANDAQKLCGVKGADARGGVGPFGLWVLASADLQEKTAVFFRVFKDGYGKPKVLMCTDPTKYGQLSCCSLARTILASFPLLKRKHTAHVDKQHAVPNPHACPGQHMSPSGILDTFLLKFDLLMT
jgi:hypothetical protein